MPMTLKILLPHKVFLEKNNLTQITAESPNGSFGILPHRLDCVSVLGPGILVYETEDEVKSYVAIDKGILVKTGLDVRISVRNAFGGTDLGKLKELIDREFNNRDDTEKKIRVSFAKLESGLIRQLNELKTGNRL